VFSDEFDGLTLDEDKWMTHFYWGHNLVSDNEIQWYTNDSFSVKNSILTITIKKENVDGWVSNHGERKHKIFNLTSGLIHTGESFKQKYGRFEIKCKLPIAPGVLPSFWLINPTSFPPEIDVFDFIDNSNSNSYKIGHIFGDDDNRKNYFEVFNRVYPVKLDDWQTFTLDWEPKKLVWYYNGYKIMEHKNIGIPQTPMYIAVNLAANDDSDMKDVDNKKMFIDWVRVYEHQK
jgi:beta-glucanase (GH16 family)